MNEKLIISLRRIATVLVFWLLLAFLIPVHETLFLANFPGIMDSTYLSDYSLQGSIIAGLVSTALAAIIFGVLEEFYFRVKLRRKSLGTIAATKTGIYLTMMVVLNTLGSFSYNSFVLGKSPMNPAVVGKVQIYLSSAAFFNNLLIYMVVLISTIFFLLVNDRFGKGMLWRFIRGKYHHPKEEYRAFMFLDIKSSTTLGEKLGHTRYFALLNDFFEDLTDPILEYNGEIYQYVGDEVVITWNERHFHKVIPCFFEILSKIEDKQSHYLSKYGEEVKFKAGAHLGYVTVGEVGVSKREIVYSGDVLNTAARIQSKCNELGQSLLISEALLNKSKLSSTYSHRHLADILLRGKEQIVPIYAVESV